MRQKTLLGRLAGIRILGIERVAAEWTVSATGPGRGACPACGTPSDARHSTYLRHLQDLPLQGVRVTVQLAVARLRCRNSGCARRIFAEPLPGATVPRCRRTGRLSDLVRLLGHNAGGRPAERILARLGMPVSDDTVLRCLRRGAARQGDAPLRVVEVDDWAWRKGQSYGTIMVDLERRAVVDVLPDRSSASTARWLREHPEVEVVSRDRHGLFAEGARDGAPQAVQVADRFHLIQNLRERIEQQLGRLGRPLRRGASVAAEADSTRAGLHDVREDLFTQVRALRAAGKTAAAITRDLGLSRKRVDRWIRLEALPQRNAMAPTTSSPRRFLDHLARRWAEGCTVATELFAEIKRLGYTGCYTHLARFIAAWRRREEQDCGDRFTTPPRPLPRDPTTGRPLSPLTAAALCIKPRPQLTERQAGIVDALKVASPEFASMRQLAMRFRGILKGSAVQKLSGWCDDAGRSGIYAMQRFAKTLQRDLDAVRNALTLPWSNGQTEGQISRLKTLKRAMYGRAGADLLRARMQPL
jgi:transposase